MNEHVGKHFSVLRTAAFGGIVFLLPLAVVGVLIGQLVVFVWPVAEWLIEREHRPFDSASAYALVTIAAIAVLLIMCFVSGWIARRSIGRWFTELAERSLIMLFPRYAVFKDQLTGNLGGEAARDRLKPVTVRKGSWLRLGVEVERNTPEWVTVYLPGAPDPWTGDVVVVPASDVSSIDADFVDVMSSFEQLGRGVGRFVGLASTGDSDP